MGLWLNQGLEGRSGRSTLSLGLRWGGDCGHEEKEISPSEAQESWTQMKTGLDTQRRIWAECGSFILDPASDQATVSADPLPQARRGP